MTFLLYSDFDYIAEQRSGGLKVDERYVVVHGDSQYGDVDALRHFQAYLYLIDWKGGHIFPSAQELKHPPADGVYQTAMTEEELMKGFNWLAKEVLGREDKLNTHFLRHLAYLFAFFRMHSMKEDIVIALAAKDAGHETTSGYKTIGGYSADANTLKQ